MNEIKSTTHRNLWEVAKAMFRGTFITVKVCARKEKNDNQPKDPILETTKKEQSSHKISPTKKIIKEQKSMKQQTIKRESSEYKSDLWTVF